MGIVERLFYLLFYIEIGRGKIINRFVGFVPEVLMVFGFLKLYGIDLKVQSIALSILILIVGFGVVGYIYKRLGWFELERGFYERLSPEFMALKRKVEELHNERTIQR